MKANKIWESAKTNLKIACEELIKSIKLIPVYILAIFILLIILKYLPDYLITYFKPSLLDNDQTITYFCTIIASFVTIGGVFLTLWHNRKMFKDQLKENEQKFMEERRQSILPVLAISKIITIPEKDVIAIIDDKVNGVINHYVEHVNEKILKNMALEETEFVLCFDRIKISMIETPMVDIFIQKGLTKEQINIIENVNLEVVTDGKWAMMRNPIYFYSQYLLINVGVGTAITLRLNVYENIIKNDSLFKNLLTSSEPINLTPMQKMKFSIFAEDEKLIGNKYVVEFEYSDIYKNKYHQEHDFYRIDEESFAFQCEVNQKDK